MSQKPTMLSKRSRTITVSDELTIARVVAQPTPSDPPRVVNPQWLLAMGIAVPYARHLVRPSKTSPPETREKFKKVRGETPKNTFFGGLYG